MSIDARVPKIFCLELASKLQKDLDLLPCVYVKDLKKADILLVGPDFKGELEEYLTLGVIPVLPSQYGFVDYNPVLELGDAFCYDGTKNIPIVFAVSRAIENFKFVYDWKSLEANFNMRLQVAKQIKS